MSYFGSQDEIHILHLSKDKIPSLLYFFPFPLVLPFVSLFSKVLLSFPWKPFSSCFMLISSILATLYRWNTLEYSITSLIVWLQTLLQLHFKPLFLLIQSLKLVFSILQPEDSSSGHGHFCWCGKKCYSICVCAQLFSRVQLSVTRWTGPTGLLCPWNFPGKNTEVGCHFPLQGIFPTQGLNLYLLHPLHQQAESSLVPPD